MQIKGDTCDSDVQTTVEVPQIQHTDKSFDVVVVIPRQVPNIQPVQKMFEVFQSQYFDRVVDMAVVMQQTQPMSQREF